MHLAQEAFLTLVGTCLRVFVELQNFWAEAGASMHSQMPGRCSRSAFGRLYWTAAVVPLVASGDLVLRSGDCPDPASFSRVSVGIAKSYCVARLQKKLLS